jgi:hypothetical protein
VKTRHWIFLILAVMGALYLLHNYMQHGGVMGVKSGLGLGS